MNRRILLASAAIFLLVIAFGSVMSWSTRVANNQAATKIAMSALAQGDSDGDGLSDVLEISSGIDPHKADTDGDGLTDGQEIHVYGTSPLLQDTDSDGLYDSDEIIVQGTNPLSQDTDGDGLLDGIDPNPGAMRTVTPRPTVLGTITATPSANAILQTATPNPTLTLQAAYEEVDRQFENLLKANIAFNKPDRIRLDATVSIELILSPAMSESALATHLIEQADFETSTADPNLLIAPGGESVTIQTSQIEITPRMKAVLLSQDLEAFVIREKHDNAEQAISSVDTTRWRWSVTGKKRGMQTLELIISQLVKYEGKEYWHEVETYKADILVEVTVSNWIQSLDWEWIAGFILALIGTILGILNWLNNNRKKAAEEKPVRGPKKKKMKSP